MTTGRTHREEATDLDNRARELLEAWEMVRTLIDAYRLAAARAPAEPPDSGSITAAGEDLGLFADLAESASGTGPDLEGSAASPQPAPGTS